MISPSPRIGADYRRSDYHFARVHSGDAPEPMSMLRPLWHDILAGLCLAAFIAVVLVMT